MVLLNHGEMGANSDANRDEQPGRLAWIRLAGQLFNSRSRSGESVKVSEIAAKYQMDEECVLS
jgi:hypothetical protein